MSDETPPTSSPTRWEGEGARPWPGASWPLPPVEEVEALGLSLPLYLHALLEERTDPDDPTGPPVLVAQLPAMDHLLDADGTISTGALVAAIDVVGGIGNGIGVVPDWVVTTNLTFRRVAPPTAPGADGALTLTSHLLRRGKTSAVGSTSVCAADGTLVATATVTSAVLTPEHGPPSLPRPFRPTPYPHPTLARYQAPLDAFVGLTAGPRHDEVRLQVLPHLRNPWNIVQGGVSAVLADAAARQTLAHPTGIDAELDELVVTDLVLHYLSPGRVGPLVARGEHLGSWGDDHVVRVVLRDQGAGDRTILLAIATVRRR